MRCTMHQCLAKQVCKTQAQLGPKNGTEPHVVVYVDCLPFPPSSHVLAVLSLSASPLLHPLFPHPLSYPSLTSKSFFLEPNRAEEKLGAPLKLRVQLV